MNFTPGLLHHLIAGLVGHRLGGDHFRRLSFKPEPINWPYEVIVGDARLRAGVNKLRGRQGRTVSSNPLLLRQIGIEGTVDVVADCLVQALALISDNLVDDFFRLFGHHGDVVERPLRDSKCRTIPVMKKSRLLIPAPIFDLGSGSRAGDTLKFNHGHYYSAMSALPKRTAGA